MTARTRARRPIALGVAALAATLLLGGCVAGEGSAQADPGSGSGDDATAGEGWSADTLTLDFATYNPLSLVIKDQGWIEDTLGDDVTVEWVQSAGSNKANEALRAGAVDVGSTAGSAALLARANGSPIRTIDIYSQPEWAALVVPEGSDITGVEDLAGRSVAATKGTDPYFFLLQALEEAGVDPADVEVQNLQHADGKAALENGSVDAWSGLDPLMAASEADAGSQLVYRNVDFNTFGFLNATQDFLDASPDLAQVVVDAYEKARAWAQENPDEVVAILAEVAGIDPAVAEKVITERTTLDIDPVPGEAQRTVLEVVGPIFVESGDVASQELIDAALDELFEPSFAEGADPATIADR
ncbi:ABC transporter substrate-binding protein [Cellulomonas hominis]|uniref:Putative aliphatic sulfonates-binding protein n=1 Tax=Cellulomonas hominis TaxID=156981 RepID=A0A511FAJ1_9CELL|nr:aliphatic sulfonate ABC transporter substrate-binding protein [Cellulomonas hominis]MBB5471432.1 sulfonate transport system substrate-binding protein [Cellulomonas hominis]NKY06400.1 aliphatic sulfonate ABC transporter substrate-binding protein [Cellulomonas hominis]NKY11142.1 aliphatic sulfonate ABC transporter substrate-binding protein [Cellulomonas hominis]GEL46262.1 ABC transporter substrate-binding protein [Cellulomonas hominis]